MGTFVKTLVALAALSFCATGCLVPVEQDDHESDYDSDYDSDGDELATEDLSDQGLDAADGAYDGATTSWLEDESPDHAPRLDLTEHAARRAGFGFDAAAELAGANDAAGPDPDPWRTYPGDLGPGDSGPGDESGPDPDPWDPGDPGRPDAED
jgi:hypothetical protein